MHTGPLTPHTQSLSYLPVEDPVLNLTLVYLTPIHVVRNEHFVCQSISLGKSMSDSDRHTGTLTPLTFSLSYQSVEELVLE